MDLLNAPNRSGFLPKLQLVITAVVPHRNNKGSL
jgi:hypothetical protein